MDKHLLEWAEARSVALVQRIAFAGVLGMVLIGILTVLDVVLLRSVFKTPIPGSNEFLATIFAVAIAAVLPSGLSQRAILEVDIFSNRLGKRRSAWLRAVGSALFLATVALITWRVAAYTYDAHLQGIRTVILQWPMWPFLWTITILFVLCVVVQFIAFLRAVESAVNASRQENLETDEGKRVQSGAKRKIAPTAAVILAAMLAGIVMLYFGITALQPVLQLYATHTAMAIWMLVLLWALTLLLMPLASAMVLCALIGVGAITGFPQALSVLGSETVGLITNADLAIIPLFLMMAGFAVAGGLAEDIFRLAQALFGFLRGGIALSTIAGCAGFGALTGSSMATVAAIGGVALKEMEDRGYSRELSTGTIAAGGTLGQLVPPSTAIVVYALLCEQSIGRLYMAVLVPAAITVLFYMIAVALTIWLKPKSAPVKDKFNGREIIVALKRAVWVFLMFGLVLGGMFAGIFTVTEAASVGAVIAFLVALFRGKLRGEYLWRVAGETTRSTAMLYFLIIGAMVISFFLGTSGLPETMTKSLNGSGLPGIAVIGILIIIYLLLGMVMDSFAIMITTVPLVLPIIVNLGYDPIWWGIIMVITVEMGVVTPPFGLNLFTMTSIAPEIPLMTVYRGVIPFILADIVKLLLLVAFPSVTLWLVYASFM